MENKKYLYCEKCWIPIELIQYIKPLPKAEAYKYSWICSIVMILSNKELPLRANIHSDVFLNKLESKYVKYISQLQKWNIIGVQLNEDNKEIYSANNPNGNSFSKCYYWTELAINSGGIVIQYNNRYKPTFYSFNENVINNEINLKDPIINYTVNVIDNFEVNYKLEDVNQLNKFILYGIDKRKETKERSRRTYKHHMFRARKVKITQNANELTYFNLFTEEEQRKLIIGEWWLKKLELNNYSVKISDKCNRCYHPIIMMPQQTREFLWFKNCNTKVYYDIKSCFPVLLMKYIPADEKEKYREYLDKDIYLSICLKESERNQCKIEFQRFINGFVNNYVKKWFRVNLPLTYEYIKTNHKTMAMNLQQTESKIMVKGLIPLCIEKNIPDILVMHDGWLSSSAAHEEVLINYVQTQFKNDCGYTPTIKKEIRTREIEIFDNDEECCLDNI